jgi:membrane protease YdiL (CAAX protease family)
MSDQPVNASPSAIMPPNGHTQPTASPDGRSNKATRAFHMIFVGPNGLRPGWRLLIYILLTIACLKVAGSIAHAFGLHAPKSEAEVTPWNMAWSRALQFLIFLFTAYIMSKIERRPVGAYGLPARAAFGKQFWEGVLIGFVSLSLLLVMLRISGAFYFGTIALGPKQALYYAGAWGLGFLMVGFFEEYVFRGYIQFTLTEGIGFWPTAILLSFLFAYVHHFNVGETWLGLIDVFLAGLVLAAMLIRTGNLWLAVGFHFAWDWAESYFYGVADSGLPATGALFHPSIPTNRPWWLTGGSVGPEGSIFSCITEILLIVFILWRFRERRYPAQDPPWVTRSLNSLSRAFTGRAA